MSAPRKNKILDIVGQNESSSFSLKDTAHYIATKEAELLGVPLTCTKLDSCTPEMTPDTTCKEFLHGKSGKILLAVEITEIKEYIIKKGKMKGRKMMFLSGEDQTASIDTITVFPDALETAKPFLWKGATVLLSGQRDRQRADSFVVEKIFQI